MSDKKKFRIIDAQNYDPATSNTIWATCGDEALIVDAKNGAIYKGNGTSLPDLVVSNSIINITYSELYQLYKNSSLVPGQRYRITDYVTKVTSKSSGDYYSNEEFYEVSFYMSSKEKPFDLIITANTKNSFNPKVIATLHNGDTYFTEKELSSLEIWYDIENSRHLNVYSDDGKGTIYRMIDSFGNECLYDFKNITFNGELTFGAGCTNNKIYGCQIVLGNECSNNVVGAGSKRIKIGKNCNGNTFGNGCRGIRLGDYCDYNTFGNGCVYKNDEIYGTCGGGLWLNYSTPRNYCKYNTFAEGCGVHVLAPGTSNFSSVLQRLHISTNGSFTEKSASNDGSPYMEFDQRIYLNEDIYNSDSKIYVETDSKRNLKIYRIADLVK